ncbi:MAG TPA: methionyl-tRNA formyltransferase [Caldimonas sp.]|nr:methionyl-tRNA formyltransferase [Caldimonas sp.]
MRIAFAGTPAFARAALQALLEVGHEVALVMTQPDRPAGRGLKMQASPVKALAQSHGIRVVQPRSLRRDGRHASDAEAAREALVDAAPEVLVVAAYGLILPEWVLELPPRGCLNIHASLLPRWRGAAPIHRAIEAGDAQTGITIMQMDAGLDTGPMVLSEPMPIRADDTTGSLQDRLAILGARLIVIALERRASLVPQPQPTAGVTYAAKIEKREAAIDWSAPAATIERRLRAFDPFPGASTTIGRETVKCWRARVVVATGVTGGAGPGEVVSLERDAIRVACGSGALDLLELQRPGGRRITAAEFLQRTPVVPRQRLGI